MLLIMIPILVIGIYFIGVINTILTSNNYNEFERLTDTVHDNLLSQLDLIENTYFNMISNQSFQHNVDQLLSGQGHMNQVNEQIDLHMQNFLYFNYPWNSKLLQSIYVFIDEETSYFYDYNNIYYNNYSYSNDDRNKSMMQILDITWDDLHEHIAKSQRINTIIPPSHINNMIYYARDFYDFHTTTFKGLIVLGIDESILSSGFQKVLHHERALGMLFNDQGVILSHTDKTQLGKTIQSDIHLLDRTKAFEEILIYDEVYLASSKSVGNRGLSMVIAIPKNEVFAELVNSIRNYLIIIFFLCILFVFISFMLTSRVSNQISTVISKLETVHKGNYDIRMEEYKEYELGKLSRIFNGMTGQIKYLINEVYQKKLLIKEAELKSLQAQINPHFLFNTLLSIGWKAKKSGDEDVFKMVNSLSELLQSTIYTDSRDKTTVENDLKNVEYYLYLQQIRFSNKFEVHISQIEQQILSYNIPKLCLQPIVENAIIHGFENKMDKCILSISTYENSEGLFFEIEDNGIGFDPSTIDLNSSYSTSHQLPNHANIGLANTHKRIKYMYGDQYGLTVHSQINKGTKVIIHIPVDRGEHDVV